MKKLTKIFVSALMVLILTACGGNSANDNIVIYASSEEYRIEYFNKRLKEEFPDKNIKIEYISTGNNAARIKSEGKDIEADIILELEEGYMEQLKDQFYTLSDYDFSKYLDDLVPAHQKYAPWIRFSGAIITNPKVLAENGLEAPTSYQDLLDPKYKGLISMPNPKASSTGYMFLKALVNAMGEDQAYEYFDQLSANILQYTTSGSGPVNALVQGEAAIGLGMTFQAVNEINKGVELEINYFEEGAPYALSGMGIIDGRQDKEGVKEVFDFIYNELTPEDKDLFIPEQIYKEQEIKIDNYPRDIQYANMDGSKDTAEKDRLLSKWKY